MRNYLILINNSGENFLKFTYFSITLGYFY